MDFEFFSAPIDLQIAIGGGYLGYLTAYAGIRSPHKQVDVALMTVAFGLVSSVAWALLGARLPFAVGVVAAVGCAVSAGALWRKIGRQAVRALMRRGKFSYANDDETVLTAILADTRHNVSQVTVGLTDGREFMCDDTDRFANAAIAPFLLGPDGSVGMYVTHVYYHDGPAKQIERVQEGVRDAEWGDNMTFIPASSIRQVDIRFQPKKPPTPSS